MITERTGGVWIIMITDNTPRTGGKIQTAGIADLFLQDDEEHLTRHPRGGIHPLLDTIMVHHYLTDDDHVLLNGYHVLLRKQTVITFLRVTSIQCRIISKNPSPICIEMGCKIFLRIIVEFHPRDREQEQFPSSMSLGFGLVFEVFKKLECQRSSLNSMIRQPKCGIFSLISTENHFLK